MSTRYFRCQSLSPIVTCDNDRGNARYFLPSSVHAIAALLIPYLPEPRSGDVGRGSRTEIFARHARAFTQAFQRVIRLLSIPHVKKMGPAYMHEIGKPYFTFDLRICSGGEFTGPPRIIVLFKGVMETSGGASNDQLAQGHLEKKVQSLVGRFAAVMPTELTVLPVAWSTAGPGCVIEEERGNQVARVRPESVGLNVSYEHSSEIRRANIAAQHLDELPNNSSSVVEAYKQLTNDSARKFVRFPRRWPSGSPDLLATCSAMLSSEYASVLSVRVQPTRLTKCESKKLHELRGQTSMETSVYAPDAERTLSLLLGQRDLFCCTIQVSSECEVLAERVSEAFLAEHLMVPDRQRGVAQSRYLARVSAISDNEKRVAAYNMTCIESIPWGFISTQSEKCAQPSGSVSQALRIPAFRTEPTQCSVESLAVDPGRTFDMSTTAFQADTEIIFERDVETDSTLARMRYLFSAEELLSIWRLPVVPPGGYLGLQSRYPNPFEQLPEPTPPNGDAISLGRVQVKGLDTANEFRVPFAPSSPAQKVPGVAGIADRSVVVAGSPGSGKTNFCLFFLGQLWSSPQAGSADGQSHSRRTPYLVIDPTRGNEFRSLIDRPTVNGSDDVLLFTVGDPRCSPFCFNPFQVPRRVSVQAHISRLMSCFRAAYEMWDPLPAIFEMALRLAYQGRREQWWQDQPRAAGRSWAAGIDFAETEDEPFPNLKDVVDAMGEGKPDEKYCGFDTIMVKQKEMWGGTTENAHTIVASTYLRLKNLSDNYDTIIGGFASGRQCVDLRKLMELPAILEFGMIGDSQALSLIMSFLVCTLAGTIEGRGVSISGDRKFHMLVLEEAHRLLAGDHGGGKQGANSKAQAAEDINTMLAEVRKYGQGVMIIDQRPGSLVGGVIDNAYLVAMHRLNEEKGFKQFVQQLNLNADQQRYARSELKPGQMVTLDRRSGLPVLVRPINKDTDGPKMSDDDLADLMYCSWVLLRQRLLAAEAEGPEFVTSLVGLIDAMQAAKVAKNGQFGASIGTSEPLPTDQDVCQLVDQFYLKIDENFQSDDANRPGLKRVIQMAKENRNVLTRNAVDSDCEFDLSRIGRVLASPPGEDFKAHTQPQLSSRATGALFANRSSTSTTTHITDGSRPNPTQVATSRRRTAKFPRDHADIRHLINAFRRLEAAADSEWDSDFVKCIKTCEKHGRHLYTDATQLIGKELVVSVLEHLIMDGDIQSELLTRLTRSDGT